MNNLLIPRYREQLSQRLSAQTLLAFDFDGSLAPIKPRRDHAVLRRRTCRLLKRLTALYPCVVISTRARRDLLARLDRIPFREVLGNHGLEPTNAPTPFRRKVQRWERILNERLAHCAGIDIEDKGVSVSIHYRRSLHKSASVAAIRAAAAALGCPRLIPGKQVIHLLPFDAIDKGTALQKIRRQLSCETALYVGDDETDEAVFRIQEEWLVGVRIGAARRSGAKYFIPLQRDVDGLLDWLIGLRSGSNSASQVIDAATQVNPRRNAAEKKRHQ
jgi:trehalose 6-phosphate phosphatase